MKGAPAETRNQHIVVVYDRQGWWGRLRRRPELLIYVDGKLKSEHRKSASFELKTRVKPRRS